MRAPEHVIVFEALSRLGNAQVLRPALMTKMAANRTLQAGAKNPQAFEYDMIKEVLDEIYPEWTNLAN